MSDALHQYIYQCLPATGCSEVGHTMMAADGFAPGAAGSWETAGASVGVYSERMVGGEATSGAEVLLMAEDTSIRLPILSQASGPGTVGLLAEALTVVPPVTGAASTDLLVGVALRHPDTSSSVDVAVVRACFSR